jgi:hypothetical protein
MYVVSWWHGSELIDRQMVETPYDMVRVTLEWLQFRTPQSGERITYGKE